MKKLLLILVLSISFIGCSKIENDLNNTKGNNNSEPAKNTIIIEDVQTKTIDTIDISKYIANSKKAQPELMLMLSDSNDINRFMNWQKEIKDDNKHNLTTKIEELYFIQVNYKGASEGYIVYTKDDKGDTYVQTYSTFPDIWVDQYNENTKAEILEKLNKSVWIKVKPLSFIDP